MVHSGIICRVKCSTVYQQNTRYKAVHHAWYISLHWALYMAVHHAWYKVVHRVRYKVVHHAWYKVVHHARYIAVHRARYTNLDLFLNIERVKRSESVLH